MAKNLDGYTLVSKGQRETHNKAGERGGSQTSHSLVAILKIRNIAKGQLAANKWPQWVGGLLSFELLKNSHASLWRVEHEEARDNSGRCEDAVSAIMGHERGSTYEGPAGEEKGLSLTPLSYWPLVCGTSNNCTSHCLIFTLSLHRVEIPIINPVRKLIQRG